MLKAKTTAVILFCISFLLAVSTLPGASPAMAHNYIIRSGDTLFSLGQKFGVQVDDLMTANDLSSDMIYPEQRLWIPSRSSRYVLGFYVEQEHDLPSSYGSMTANSNQISAVAPFWYRLAPDSPAAIEEHRAPDGTGACDPPAIISGAHKNNIQVLALIHNMIYAGQVDGAGLAAAMLENEHTRGVFINQLEGIIKAYGYDGVNLDIENIRLADRDKFSLFVKELFQRLAPQGSQITVCVPAKTHDNLQSAWSGPFDYAQIGMYSHSVIIMTYDEHGYSSGPGAIASSGWVRDVVKYAAQNISPEKILLGIPGYGFDWTAGQAGPRYISFGQAMTLAKSQQANILWDNGSQAPYFKYCDSGGRGHEVWFENAFSLTNKLDLIEEYDLKGLAIWRLGMEDPGVWDVLGGRIIAEKTAVD
ncbi:MAG: glycosyl hydrolase family 18 protein [Desulfotomaculaceae bacterium]|nr:glycosyl hydrolase family 18 protein [Desulfotomaculaceae bacterium]